MNRRLWKPRHLNLIAAALCMVLLGGTPRVFGQAPAVAGRAPGAGQAPAVATGVKFAQLSEADAREWLTFLSSDALMGRQVFTDGYGIAAEYIAGHLRQWGVKPMGDNGTYFQSVKYVGYRITRNSSITVDVAGQSRTFKHGDHVTFPTGSGGRQTLTFRAPEFAGYGLTSTAKGAPHDDFADRDVKGKLVVFVPGGPASIGPFGGFASGSSRADSVQQVQGAAATIRYGSVPAPPPQPSSVAPEGERTTSPDASATPAAPAPPAPAAGRGGRGRGAGPAADLTTTERVDALLPPALIADETFLEFLFTGAPVKFSDIRMKSERGEAIAPFTLANATVTVTVDDTYEAVSTQLTENVVGMIEGRDPRLKDTYVFFGAHLDHVGYSQTAAGRGRINVPLEQDRIWNGADDDGSGSTAIMALAKAFATGPKPKRSVVVVWHAGEEAGLLGSLYMADHPVVPLEKIQAEFNIDMIGRNRDDDPSQANTLYVIGADRISTDLHNLVVGADEALDRPLTLDFEFNDPNDSNSFYTRSDHYSYASKGIPIAFFFTGTHPDYHANTDSVDKILFPKLVRVAQFIYQAGYSVADSDRVLERDNKGPRSGKGFQGTLPR
ncbi:MAG: M28 family peptidase [Acidobacteriota bacterium]